MTLPIDQIAEIQAMTDQELIAAHNVIFRQVNAPLLIGNRENRQTVLDHIKLEANARGYAI